MARVLWFVSARQGTGESCCLHVPWLCSWCAPTPGAWRRIRRQGSMTYGAGRHGLSGAGHAAQRHQGEPAPAPRLGRARGMARPVGSTRRTVLATGLACSQTAIFQTAQGNDLFEIGDILRPAMRRDDLTDGVEGGHVLMAQHPRQIAGIDDPAGQQLHQG